MSSPPDDRDLLDQVFRSYVLTTTALYRAQSHDFVSLLQAAEFPLEDVKNKNWSGVSFDHQDLQGLDFSGCDLRGATFDRANVAGCKFEGAIYLKDTFTGAAGLEAAVFEAAPSRKRIATPPREDGYRLAEKLIAEEAKTRTGILDLGGLALDALPPALGTLQHLHTLSLGAWWVNGEDRIVDAGHALGRNTLTSGLQPIGQLRRLERLFLCKVPIDDLSAIADLKSLVELVCSGTLVGTLGPLAGLSNLQRLNCSATQVADLEPLKALAHLTRVTCSQTAVTSLAPLSGLTRLKRLDCVDTSVANLEPLRGLPDLEWLNCSSTMVTDLTPVSDLKRLKRINVSRTDVSDLSPLAGHMDLISLDIFRTAVSDLTPLTGLSSLQRINCSSSDVYDIGPLASLPSLVKIDLASTDVQDLTPLSGLTRLTSVACSSTRVRDLAPLAGLNELSVLHCFNTRVSDLSPLRGLRQLEWINISGTRVDNLAPLSGLQFLRKINVARTAVASFEPLAGLMRVEEIDCANTPIRDLFPLKGSRGLKRLACSRTKIATLEPLRKLPHLEHVSCSHTPIRSLSPVLDALSIRSVRAQRCRLSYLPEDSAVYWKLEALDLTGTRVEGFPNGLFHGSGTDVNHAPLLIAYLDDQAASPPSQATAKLVVLGNHAAGKAGVIERILRGLGDDAASPGAFVRKAVRPQQGDRRTASVSVFEFDGQAFDRKAQSLVGDGPSVFVVCWSPTTEGKTTPGDQREIRRDMPLDAWLKAIAKNAGLDVPVVVVQTNAGGPSWLNPMHERADAELARFAVTRDVAYSSLADRDHTDLDTAIAESLAWVRRTGDGELLNKRWRAVIDQLAAIAAHQDLEKPENQLRTLTRTEFDGVCADIGGISAPQLLLKYLDNAGEVIVVAAEVDDVIVLNPRVAKQALQHLRDADPYFRRFDQKLGRFRRSDYDQLPWNNHSRADQDVLLQMMENQGLLVLLPPIPGADRREYLALDVLPSRSEIGSDISRFWRGNAKFELERLEVPLVGEAASHDAFLTVMTAFARLAGSHGVYWSDGMAAYDAKTRSAVFVEKQGLRRLSITTRGLNSELLLSRASTAVSRILQKTRQPQSQTSDLSHLVNPSDFAFGQTMMFR